MAEEKKTTDAKDTNEKKEIKLSLKAVVLIIMLLILAFVILMNMYFKEAKNIRNFENGHVKKTETVKMTEFKEDEAALLLSQYLEDRSLAYSNPQALLEKYQMATNAEISKYEKTKDEKYLKSNILYSDIQKLMEKYITRQFFMKQFKDIYVSSNGIAEILIKDTPLEVYEITRYELQESKSPKKTLVVWYTVKNNTTKSVEKNMKVEFSKVQDNWVISDIK